MANSIKMSIELDGKDALKTIQALQKGIVDTGKSTEKVAKQSDGFLKVWAGNLAAIATVKFGAFIKAQVGEAIDSFIAFEEGLVSTAKTAGLTDKEMAELGDSINNLAKTLPVTTKELLDITTAAGQLGVKGTKNLTLFADTISKLGRVSNLSGSEAATTLTRILNVTNEGIDDIDEFASGIVALGNNFAATEAEIALVTNEVARATAQFGVSAGEAAALSTAMRSLGVRAEEAGTVTSKSFLAIQDAVMGGGAALKQLEKITGESGSNLKKQFGEDAIGVFQRFLEGANRLQQGGASLKEEFEKLGLSGIRIQKTLPTLAANFDEVTRALEVYKTGSVDANALNEEFERGLGTLQTEMTLFGNAIDEIGRSIVGAFGGSAAGTLGVFTARIQQMLAWFSGSEMDSAQAKVKGLESTIQDVTSTTRLVNKLLPQWLENINNSRADARIARINEELVDTKNLMSDLKGIDPSAGIAKLTAEIATIDKNTSDPILSGIYGSKEDHAIRRAQLQAELDNLVQIKKLHDGTLGESEAEKNQAEIDAKVAHFELLKELQAEQDAFNLEKKELDKEIQLEDDEIDLEALKSILGEKEAIKEVARIQELAGEEKQEAALGKLRERARKKQAKDKEKADKARLAFEQQIGNQRIQLAGNVSNLVTAVLGSESKAAFIISKAAAAAQLAIGTAQALAMVPAQTAAIPYPANIAAGLQLASYIKINAGIQAATIAASAIAGFQDGGIVGGTSQVNDRQLIRANAGERILTARENRVLTEQLDGSNQIGGGNTEIVINNPTLLNEEMIDDLIDNINDAQEFRNKELRVG